MTRVRTVRHTRSAEMLPRDLPARESSLVALSCPGVKDGYILDSSLFNHLYVRKTKTKRPFWISTHDEKYDRMRHDIFRKGYYYEKWFTHLLERIATPSRM